MTIKLHFIAETALARKYENAAGQQQWFPRAVLLKTMKWPAKDGRPPLHEVEVEDWFLEKHPWPERPAQPEMKL